MRRPAVMPALHPNPKGVWLFGDHRLFHRRRLIPATLYSDRQDVDMRADVADVVHATGTPWVVGSCGNIDVGILHPQVRIGDIKGEALPDFPTGADREPETVIVRQAWCAHLVCDWRNFVTDAAAQRQPVAPFVFAAD